MNTLEKLRILGASAAYDRCGCECKPGEARHRRRFDVPRDGIYPATASGGRRTLLLKVLQSNECINDCRYCGNRAGRGYTKTSFGPGELADLFFNYLNLGYVEGLFLSSAVSSDCENDMERILEMVGIIRGRGFRGYVHTKILPGASRDQVRRAAMLSTRLSINLEAPNKNRLGELSSQKDFQVDLLRRMEWVSQEVRRGRVSAGHTTQFVVGAAGESDLEILDMCERLYGRMGLARSYFSAFNPISDTPLEETPGTPKLREYRLYQTDFLFRQYGFRVGDLVLDDGFLPLHTDPKTAYAREHSDLYPMDVNNAAYGELLRIPGVGPKTANTIVNARESKKIRSLHELKNLGVQRKTMPYVAVDEVRQVRLTDFSS